MLKRSMMILAVVVFSQVACATPPEAGEDWPVTVTPSTLMADSSAPGFMVQRAYGGPGEDTAYDLWPTRDGGYVIVGSTEHPERGDRDLAVLKVSQQGELLWAKRFGGPRIEIGFGVRTLKDGTIVVAGWTQSFGAGEGDFYLLGLDQEGGLKFERTFGGPGEERAVSLTVTREDTILIIGEAYGHGAGDSRFYLVKASADGELIWEKTYDGGPLHERGLALVEAEDGFLLVGSSMDATSGSRATISNGYAVRVDADGNELWSRSYGGEQHDIFHHVARLENGQYLLTGYTRGFGAKGENDLWLVTITGAGEIQDSRLLGGEGADHNIIARKAPDGGIYLAGYSQSGPMGSWDAQVVRLDPDGKTEWMHYYGGPDDDGAVAVYPSGEDGLAVTGFTQSFGAGSRDILFMVIWVPR